MAKGTKEVEEMDEVVEEGGIELFEGNFYREDMNALVVKLNEVIEAVNAL